MLRIERPAAGSLLPGKWLSTVVRIAVDAVSYERVVGAATPDSLSTAKEIPVSKTKDTKKAQKKEPTKTLKEKRDAKKAKKEEKKRQGV